MANPRKRKVAKLAVLALEQTDATDVAAQSQSIAAGTSALGTDGQAAVRNLSRAALTALATDDTGNINPDTTVSRRGSLKFVAGEARVMLPADAEVPSGFTETAVPHYVMADGNSAGSDGSGCVFDNSFDSLNIPALHGSIGRDGANNVVFSIDMSDAAVSIGDTNVTLTIDNGLRVLTDATGVPGDDGFATINRVHDIVTGDDGINNLGADLSINRSLAIALEAGSGETNTDADDGVASEILVQLSRDFIGEAAPAWVAGDVVRITSASGTVYDFTAGVAQNLPTNTFEAGTSITATMVSLRACVDQHPGLDMSADAANPNGSAQPTADASGDIAIYDVMGQGVDAGFQLELLDQGGDALGGPGSADGIATFNTGADLAAAVAPGANGTTRAADASQATAYANATNGGSGNAAVPDNIADDTDTVTVEFDEFPVQVVYNVPANDLLHQIGDRGFVVSWVIN